MLDTSKHLDFEMIQFNYCIRRLALKDYGDDFTLYNALLTAFTVHTRNLEDFFYGAQSKPDDMLAYQFFDDFSYWLTICPPRSSTLETAGKKVDKLTAHLTYTRETDPNFYWLWIDIHKDLKRVVTKFVDYVPHHRIDIHIINFRTDWAWSDVLAHSDQYKP